MFEDVAEYVSNNLEIQLGIIKIVYIFICSYFCNIKILNQKIKLNFKYIFKFILIVFNSILFAVVRYEISYVISILGWIFMTAIIFNKNEIRKSVFTTLVSLSINYIILLISTTINFIINIIFGINSNIINIVLIFIIHITLLILFFNVKKFKYGISSLKNIQQNEYIDILILTISSIILFSCILLSKLQVTKSISIGFIIFSISMIITIFKSIQLYYKQQMLIKDLNETREELEKKKKEIAELEAENIEISKKRHTIVHKQKSLEHKLEEIITKTEISSEEVAEVRERIKKLNNEIYDKEKVTELDKTGITNIDDMLKYMQDECIKNQISFTLKLTGNIHYMINNFISKDDLETLLADHIKDAIIAINHTDNINRSILVRLGEINRMYGLYIYDSGIEFKKEVLENLGNKPFTTYKNEGGTGMGFMNTFDTLRKYNASLSIEEFNEPIIDNYTKVIAIKFDKKKEVKIKSYQGIDINKFI